MVVNVCCQQKKVLKAVVISDNVITVDQLCLNIGVGGSGAALL